MSTENNGLRCDVCGQRFESEAALRRHVHDVGLVD
jgi:hypothetical protein